MSDSTVTETPVESAAPTEATPPTGPTTDIVQVKADVKGLNTQATNLEGSITTFQLTWDALIRVFTIVKDAAFLAASLISATTNAKNLTPRPVSDDDAREILDSLASIKPVIMRALDAVVEKKSIIHQIPGASLLAARGLSEVNTAIMAYANALAACAPESVTKEGHDLKDEVEAAFAKAIASFPT